MFYLHWATFSLSWIRWLASVNNIQPGAALWTERLTWKFLTAGSAPSIEQAFLLQCGYKEENLDRCAQLNFSQCFWLLQRSQARNMDVEFDGNWTTFSRRGLPLVENILDHFPDNPVQDPLGRYWIHMTNNYSVFQIATFGSLLMHEVL